MSVLRWVLPVWLLLVIVLGFLRPGWVQAIDRWTGRPTIFASNRRRAHRAPGRAR